MRLLQFQLYRPPLLPKLLPDPLRRFHRCLHRDENDIAAGRFLAPMDWQALAVEGVPAIVDRYDFGLRKMMGIM